MAIAQIAVWTALRDVSRSANAVSVWSNQTEASSEIQRKRLPARSPPVNLSQEL